MAQGHRAEEAAGRMRASRLFLTLLSVGVAWQSGQQGTGTVTSSLVTCGPVLPANVHASHAAECASVLTDIASHFRYRRRRRRRACWRPVLGARDPRPCATARTTASPSTTPCAWRPRAQGLPVPALAAPLSFPSDYFFSLSQLCSRRLGETRGRKEGEGALVGSVGWLAGTRNAS